MRMVACHGSRELSMKRILYLFTADQRGATAIEYGLIAGMIGSAILLPVSAMGSEVSATLLMIADLLIQP
jgi:pilus assembly protein Flp/PilA